MDFFYLFNNLWLGHRSVYLIEIEKGYNKDEYDK
jgi:hypothetical protein